MTIPRRMSTHLPFSAGMPKSCMGNHTTGYGILILHD
jgi:hypothetical protein